MDKCPYCGSYNFGKITPTKGNRYGLTEINTNTKQVFADTLLIVDVYGCLDCKGIILKNEDLKRN